MTLEQKLKLTFDPTKIDPVITTESELILTVNKLRIFDEKLYSMENSIQNSAWTSMWDSIWYSMQTSIRDSAWASIRDSAWASMKKSLRDSMENKMKDSTMDLMWASIRKQTWISIMDSMGDSMSISIWTSMSNAIWASICVNLSKDEYESLFEYKEILKELPYDQVKELCDLYHWFSKRGFFIHRSFKKGDYLLASWKNPKRIQTIHILQGGK